MARSRLSPLASAAGLLVVLMARLAPPAFAARSLMHGGRHLTQAAGGLTLPCDVVGGGAGPTWLNTPLTCVKLHSMGSPIAVPDDTATLKYGQVIMQSFTMDGATAAFTDRTGKQWPISASANPPTDPGQLWRIYTLIIVQAELDEASGNVTAFQPWLYVPYSTVMESMANMQFEGVLTNSAPLAPGPNATSYFRWTFGSNITVTDPTYKYGTLLQGTFSNLFQSVRDQHGVCRPALCDDPKRDSAACKYYAKFFGNSDAMTLRWDPNMFQVPGTDPELVPMFPAAKTQYMASFTELYQLLAPNSLPRSFTFFFSGTPLGVPQSFRGTFTPAKPLTTC